MRRKIANTLSKNVVWAVVFCLFAAWFGLSWLVLIAERTNAAANITSYGEALWWGIVTVLTVGYGDRYPITTAGRVYAGFLMATGVVSVGILTAKVSSYFLEQALREGRGEVDFSKFRDHFVICGWKDEMHEILTHILDFNQDLKADRIILIANLNQTAISEMKAHPRLKDIHIIVGDYFSEINLTRANPIKARKVMILADRTPHPNGTLPTMTEVDARTVMTAMTLSHVARGALIAAEVLDPKMDHYLKLASVSEIIYSREYNRLLLGNASGGTGVANIIFDLLNPHTSSFLTTTKISDDSLGKSYSELKNRFSKEKNKILIGILENSGTWANIKELALRKAQQTTDVSKLLTNLQSVKGLKCNQPYFNPPDDYTVGEGSMAIVIEQRGSSDATSHAA